MYEVVSTFFTSMTPLIGGTLWGVIEVKKVDMTSYTAVRNSKIKFWVGYKFFLNGYKKNLPLIRSNVGSEEAGIRHAVSRYFPSAVFG